ncbi:putative secreted protein [Salmonella enterica subsp. enterica]|uniref:Putative secreted protein n=1 Tax=Salmonella enterica I TaxID=59201 RepID=A0A447PTW9_SALET|nr:putative secreted protein [Salmonella enterica subsp. enterica]
MKKRIIAAALLATVASFSTLAAEQVSKQEISHFKLVKVGTINVSPEWRADFPHPLIYAKNCQN